MVVEVKVRVGWWAGSPICGWVLDSGVVVVVIINGVDAALGSAGTGASSPVRAKGDASASLEETSLILGGRDSTAATMALNSSSPFHGPTTGSMSSKSFDLEIVFLN